MVRELRGSLQENAQLLDEMEEDVNEDTPQLFKDFLGASEEDRVLMEVSRLQLLRKSWILLLQ